MAMIYRYVPSRFNNNWYSQFQFQLKDYSFNKLSHRMPLRILHFATSSKFDIPEENRKKLAFTFIPAFRISTILIFWPTEAVHTLLVQERLVVDLPPGTGSGACVLWQERALRKVARKTRGLKLGCAFWKIWEAHRLLFDVFVFENFLVQRV
jgi:hypothetical protein